jgi:hypothetical protein
MKKTFNLKCNPTKKQNDDLYQLFHSIRKTESCVHNFVPNLKVPFEVEAVLSLGLKFTFPLNPNFQVIRESVLEGIRKISWNLFFWEDRRRLSKLEETIIKIKKDVNKFKPKVHCNLEPLLIPEIDDFLEALVSKLYSNTKVLNPVYSELIESFKSFQVCNNLIIVEADKNAGICILNKSDYSEEIFRQLDDVVTYFPSTKYQFESKSEELRDEIRRYAAKFPECLNLKTLIPDSHSAASFYILPKVHKDFDRIPKGRPISSNIKTLNRGVSRLLDMILQPVMNFMPDIILDTAHFLLLLGRVKLDPGRKYMLVTADIEGLYPNLKIQDCISHVCVAHEKFKTLINYPFNLSPNLLYKLLQWSLNYSFVEFENNYYFQHRGIPMGNSASVSIANITVYSELVDFYKQCSQAVFYVRFIDDIFMIVDVSQITDFSQWISDKFIHRYLKFTTKFNSSSIDFLDTTIRIKTSNIVETALYKKPISKHKFLHYNSAHPRHLVQSLPYSNGLRVIRTCSNPSDRDSELSKLMEKFRERHYPEPLIQQSLNKLSTVSQVQILTPKKALLQSNLRIHRPEILSEYRITIQDRVDTISNKVYIVIPFYKNVLNLGSLIRQSLLDRLNECSDEYILNNAKQIIICIAFKQPNSLKRFISNSAK